MSESKGRKNGLQIKLENMATNKLKKLQEIRVGLLAFRTETGDSSLKYDEKGRSLCLTEAVAVGNNLEILASGLMSFLIILDFKLPNTEILTLAPYDSDTYFEEIKELKSNKTKLGGSDSFNHFGFGIMEFSRKEFQRISNDLDQLIFLSTAIRDALVFYCEKFNIDASPIFVAYNCLISTDFYFPLAIKNYKNSNGKFIANIQSRPGLRCDDYRLAILNTLYSIFHYFPICKKANLAEIFKEKKMWEYNPLSNFPPFTFENKRWVNSNKFCFQWGENESYSFDLKEMVLRKPINI